MKESALERRERREKARAEMAAERARMEREHGMAKFSQKARDKLWGYAWEEGHGHGYHNVELIYSDLADIVKAFVAELQSELEFAEKLNNQLHKEAFPDYKPPEEE